jgi:single-strand DNA-binding protein
VSDTSVTVTGNCTRDPELRYGNGNTAVASFSVAVSSRRKNENGEWENGESSFYDVACFGRLAENVAESVSKGQRVLVHGTLKQSTWEKDNQKRSKVEIVASDVGRSMKWDSLAIGGSPVVRPVVSNEEPF